MHPTSSTTNSTNAPPAITRATAARTTTATSTEAPGAQIQKIGNTVRRGQLPPPAAGLRDIAINTAVAAYQDKTAHLPVLSHYQTDMIAVSESARANIMKAAESALEDPCSSIGKSDAADILESVGKNLVLQERLLLIRAKNVVTEAAKQAEPATTPEQRAEISATLDTMVKEAVQTHKDLLLPMLGVDPLYHERDIIETALVLSREQVKAFADSTARLPASITQKASTSLARELANYLPTAQRRREVAIEKELAARQYAQNLLDAAAEELHDAQAGNSALRPGAATMQLTTLVPGMPDLQTLLQLPTVDVQAQQIGVALKNRIDAIAAEWRHRPDPSAGNESGWQAVTRAIWSAATIESSDNTALVAATLEAATHELSTLRETLRGKTYTPEQREHMKQQMQAELQKFATQSLAGASRR